MLTRTNYVIGSVFTWANLIPVAYLVRRQLKKIPDDAPFLWASVAFVVSFISDASVLYLHAHGPLISLVYPVSQAGIVAAVLFRRKSDSLLFMATLVAVGIFALSIEDLKHYDAVLRTWAWLGVCLAARDVPAFKRFVWVYFGAALFAWYVLLTWGNYPTYFAYKGIQMAGMLLFCWAVSNPSPKLRLT